MIISEVWLLRHKNISRLRQAGTQAGRTVSTIGEFKVKKIAVIGAAGTALSVLPIGHDSSCGYM